MTQIQNASLSMRLEMERLKPLLQKEEAVHLTQIGTLYRQLDRRFHLSASLVPIEFTYDTEVLGSYTPGDGGEEEMFRFSLFFIGYAVKHPMEKEDRKDLFLHEYAHYMVKHMDIPREYTHQSGKHGSAWKYCCSLIGAAPTPGYRAGEALEEHDYDKVLKKNTLSKTVPMVDQYRREMEYQKQKKSRVQFKEGELIRHPKYGEGEILRIEQQTGSVRLVVRFGEEEKKIDQEWLLKTMRGSGR